MLKKLFLLVMLAKGTYVLRRLYGVRVLCAVCFYAFLMLNVFLHAILLNPKKPPVRMFCYNFGYDNASACAATLSSFSG